MTGTLGLAVMLAVTVSLGVPEIVFGESRARSESMGVREVLQRLESKLDRPIAIRALEEKLDGVIAAVGRIAEETKRTPWWRIGITLATFLSALAAAGAAIVSAWSARAIRSGARYTYLANLWYEIRKEEFDNPRFVDEVKTQTYAASFEGDERRRYELFAWRCWGHAEDIYLNGFQTNPGFRPTLSWYKKLHAEWLAAPENAQRFEPKFLDLVKDLKPL